MYNYNNFIKALLNIILKPILVVREWLKLVLYRAV